MVQTDATPVLGQTPVILALANVVHSTQGLFIIALGLWGFIKENSKVYVTIRTGTESTAA
jgi:hypothetical protein